MNVAYVGEVSLRLMKTVVNVIINLQMYVVYAVVREIYMLAAALVFLRVIVTVMVMF